MVLEVPRNASAMLAGAGTGARETDSLLTNNHLTSRNESSSLQIRTGTRFTWPWQHVIILAMVAGVISCMGEDLMAAPKIRLLESSLCSRYYSRHNPSISRHGEVSEHMCKIDSVQDELAAILGGQFFFDSLPAILFPIPYGLAADRYGRKWIMVTSLIGFTFSYAWICVSVSCVPFRSLLRKH